MLKIYLDNCCYNRPFDDLSQAKIREEATAKMFIQSLVKYGSLSLVFSYMSLTEINDSPFESSKQQIMDFINDYSDCYVTESKREEIEKTAKDIMSTGIKQKDAVHIAFAIISQCDYFITTDKRLLKHITDKLNIVNPIDFIKLRGKIT